MTDLAFLQTQNEEIVNFSTAQYAVDETSGQITIGLTRTNPRPGLELRIDVVIEPITAIQNLHYMDNQLEVFFAVGATSSNGSIVILDADLGTGVSKTFRVKLAEPPSVDSYTRGTVSEAVVTINGITPMGQNGFIQFETQAVSIPENAGTDSTTCRITRTGTVSPGAASVVVNSVNGSAIAPAAYSPVINFPVNWGVGDSSTKTVPFTPVNQATQQGDRTCQLTMSNPVGAQIGTLGSQTISILDLTPPAALGAYPIRGGYHIGDPHDYTSSSKLDLMQSEDIVIWSTQPSLGISSYQAKYAALKARNPSIIALAYWDQMYARDDTSQAFFTNYLNYLKARTGVPGLSVAPNDWLFQNSSGVQEFTTIFGGSFYPYFQVNAVADSSGRSPGQYTAQYLKENLMDLIPAADGLFADDFVHRPPVSAVVASNNVYVSANDAARRVSWRSEYRKLSDKWKALTPKLFTANVGGWWQETASTIASEFSGFQIDGGCMENCSGTSFAKNGLNVSGTSIVQLTNGQNFNTFRDTLNNAIYATQNWRTRPPLMMAVCSCMTLANRNGSGKAAGYRHARYCMGEVWICSDLDLHLHDKTQTNASYSTDGIAEFDEEFGENIAGLTPTQKMAAGRRKWMGLPLGAKVTSPTQQGCYTREFQNCFAVVNPQGNGTKTITMPPGVWRLIAGGQDPTINTGSTVGSTYTLGDQDARFFKKVP